MLINKESYYDNDTDADADADADAEDDHALKILVHN